jgi:hypothetical protein
MALGDKTYTTAAGKWRRSDTVTIVSIHDKRIARFPIDFLATCGDNTWSYVNHVVSLLVVVDPDHSGSILDPATGLPVDPDAAPTAGQYRYVEEGG